jgi:hypothetical protein
MTGRWPLPLLFAAATLIGCGPRGCFQEVEVTRDRIAHFRRPFEPESSFEGFCTFGSGADLWDPRNRSKGARERLEALNLDRSGAVIIRSRFRRLLAGPYGEVFTYERVDYREAGSESSFLLEGDLPHGSSPEETAAPPVQALPPLSAVSLVRIFAWPSAYAIVWTLYHAEDGTARRHGAFLRDPTYATATTHEAKMQRAPAWFQGSAETWAGGAFTNPREAAMETLIGFPLRIEPNPPPNADSALPFRRLDREEFEDIANWHYAMGQLVKQVRRKAGGKPEVHWLRFPELPADRHLAERDGPRFTLRRNPDSIVK